MFTILNLLNYLAGKPLNVFVLITISIGVYFYLIKYYWDTIYNSYTYTAILIFLLILDLITIILIYFYDRKIDPEELNENVKTESSNIILGVENQNHEQSKKKKKNKKSKKDSTTNKPESNYIRDGAERELISLFDINKDPSLHTY